jgi:hypothetical protein
MAIRSTGPIIDFSAPSAAANDACGFGAGVQRLASGPCRAGLGEQPPDASQLGMRGT